MRDLVRESANESIENEIAILHQLDQTICNKIDRESRDTGESKMVCAWNTLTTLLPEYRAFKEMGIRPTSARGLMAEIMLKYILESWAKKRGISYVYYGNLLLPRPDGGTTQLDGVFITPTFAAVVECKSYYGKLTIENGKIKGRTGVATPWKQNYGHIISLKKVLGDKARIYFHNVVYIFSEGIITDYEPTPEEYLMVNRVALSTLDHLNKNQNFRNELSQADLNEVANELEQYIPSVAEEEEHIQFVNSLIQV